ncbi:MAG: zinc-binding dehydrogenase [Oscillospiraceae bacterium]|nr:zinc-binding dehydrogenase [Oscillospiraceae bacterium]
MKAVVLDKTTKAEDITISEVAIPDVRPGWVLIKIKAFGLNHSEKLLRLNEIRADYIQKPIIPGIECVGEVENPSDTDLRKGQKIVALMGGMGRSFNGSYAEYALLPRRIVFPINSDLSWEALGAVPETYFTAWCSLFECLRLTVKDTLLIRGATCALGYASLQIAKALGCKVIATTHREDKLPLIAEADEAVIDDGKLTGKVRGITKALDLIGPRNLKDTLTAVEKGGVVCQTGLLGGVYTLNGFDPIKDIPNGVYLTGFFSNYPTQRTIDAIFAFLRDRQLVPVRGQVFDFDHIREAITAQDAGSVEGKIVVTL